MFREKYITEELPSLIASSDLPIDTKTASIFGHSMGGHGALTLYLNHAGLYKSSSAFAPITNPINAPWGKKAFAGPNGNDGYLAGGIEEGKKYDATEIIAGKKGEDINILIDTGTGDNLYVWSLLHLRATLSTDHPLLWIYPATKRVNCSQRTSKKQSRRQVLTRQSRLTIGMVSSARLFRFIKGTNSYRPFICVTGYDHSYFFIQTFGPDHIAYHAKFLKA